jgi:general secretion pathway protein K
VTVLPVTTPINVNTATAAALQALVPNLTAARAQQLMERQRSGGFESMEQFAQLSGAEVGQAALASNYFEVRVTVQYNDRLQYLRSVLRRSNSGAMSVVSRERGIPFAANDDGNGQPRRTGSDTGAQQQQ